MINMSTPKKKTRFYPKLSPEVIKRKRETALNNLKKARTIETEPDNLDTSTLKESTLKSTLKESTLQSTLPTKESTLKSTSKSTLKESTREYTEECTKEIMSTLGEHVRKLSKGTSASVLKSAYGYKSLVDTYLNLQKVVYPQGITQEGTSHLTALLGSVLPDLKDMLRVNINIGINPANASPVPLVPPSVQPPTIESTQHVVEEEGTSD